MRGDDQQAPFGIVRVAQRMQGGTAGQAAEAPVKAQAPVTQRLLLTGQVQVAPPVDAALEILAVVADPHLRIEQPAEPAGADAHLEDQGLGRTDIALNHQPALLQARRQGQGIGRKSVAVIILRTIEQMIGEPGLVGDPAQHQRQRHQPPGDQQAEQDQRHQGDQHEEALVAAMALQQLLLAGCHGVKPDRPAPGGTTDPCIRGRHARRNSAAACPSPAPRPRRPGC